MSFTPCYTWPSASFPFRIYYNKAGFRIFLIENIFHNFSWLQACQNGITDNDYFLVILGWHHSDWHAKHSKDCISECGLDIKRFIILCNDYSDLMIFSDHGFTCRVINQNCFLDYDLFRIHSNMRKKYDALYIARLTPFKRHTLAALVENLALVSGNLHGGEEGTYIPNHTYRNKQPLTPTEVQTVIGESRVGLILSEVEGACFASSEYLLCGVPVVSTISKGGRSIWYNDYNSEICDATPQEVAKSVAKLIERNPCPEKIRSYHLFLSNTFRKEFVSLLSDLFEQNKIGDDAEEYFSDNFFHKMRESIKPDFFNIFGVDYANPGIINTA